MNGRSYGTTINQGLIQTAFSAGTRKDITQTIKNKKSSFKDWTPQQFTSKNISPNIDTKFPFCRMTKDISHAIVTCARLQQLWKQVENLTDHKTV